MSEAAGHRIVEAEEFALKDSKGQVRATLGTRREEPFLALLDPIGTPRAALFVQDGDPHLLLYDRLGESKLRLSLRGEWPELRIGERNGIQETSLLMGKNETFFSLGGPPGAQGVYVSLRRERSSLVFHKPMRGNGGKSVWLRAAKEGPSLTLHATKGGPKLEISVRGQKPVFAFLDKKGKRIMSFSLVGGEPVAQIKKNGRFRAIRLADIEPEKR